MKYKFEYSNNHPVIEIDGRTYVVDTGSPISFFLDGHSGALTINNRSFSLTSNPMHLNRECIENLVGKDINGFIGLDILTCLKSIYMNRTDNYVEFDVSCVHNLANNNPLKLKKIMGMSYLEVPVKVNGYSVQAIIDSGACISYVSRNLVESSRYLGRVSDYSPSFGGEINTDKYEVELSFGGNTFNSGVAAMTQLIELSVGMLGYKVVLGFGEIQWNELCIDIGAGRICYDLNTGRE